MRRSPLARRCGLAAPKISNIREPIVKVASHTAQQNRDHRLRDHLRAQ